MDVDLNDPTTWDSLSNHELLDLANKGVVAGSEEPKAEEPKAEEPKAEEPKAEEPKAEEPILLPSDTLPEGAAILAADGKNTIPYSVLRDAREDARAARVELQRLQRELEALKTQPTAPIATAPVPVSTDLPESVKQEITKIRENWGDDIAAQAERTWRVEQQTIQQQQIIDQLLQQVQDQQQRQTRSEAEQIEDAIATSPKLDAWAKAEDQGWFDRAVELHTVLMKTDKLYAGLSWHDRMAKLPDRVEALYGPSFQKIDTPRVMAKAKEVLERPPTSLSDLIGGSTPEKSDLEKIDDLEGNYLTGYLQKIASKPGELEKLLRRYS